MSSATDHPDVVPVTPSAGPGTIELPPTLPKRRRTKEPALPITAPAAPPTLAVNEDVVAAMRQEIQTEQAIHEMVEELVLKFLKPGEDYGISHGKHCPERTAAAPFGGPGRCPKCHRKPDLWLPGAEKIVKRLGFAFGLPEVATDIMQAVHIEVPWIAFRTALINKRTGEVVGHGIGAQTLLQADGDPNKMIKMGKKSSIIDCAKTNFALSGFFTQDSETVDRPEPTPATGAPAPVPAPVPMPAPLIAPGVALPMPPTPTVALVPAKATTLRDAADALVENPAVVSALAKLITAPSAAFAPASAPAPVPAPRPPAPAPAPKLAAPAPAPRPAPPTPTPVPVTIPDRATPSLDSFVNFYALDGGVLQRLYWCAGWDAGLPVTEANARTAYELCEKALSNWIQAHGGWPPEAATWTAAERQQHIFLQWLQELEVFYRQNFAQRGASK